MFRTGFVVFLALAALQARASTDPVATINDRKISLKEFQEKYAQTEVAFNRPDQETFLEDLVRYEMGVMEAERRGLDKDPIIKERMRQEMYKLLLERELGDKVQAIKINESEMKASYERSPEIRSSHILIEVKPNAGREEIAAARKRAEEILKEVRASKRPFEELVRLYTDDTLSKPAGGDIGFQSRVSAVPTYYDALVKLKKNDIAPSLIRTSYGFHIAKLTDRRSYNQADKTQIRAVVFEEKRKQIFDAYFKKLRAQYKIQTNRAALKGDAQ
jgi:peptidyl-prolyl cis-trans isomerase C/peptidyl-prolyl cis-trans isomerase D